MERGAAIFSSNMWARFGFGQIAQGENNQYLLENGLLNHEPLIILLILVLEIFYKKLLFIILLVMQRLVQL